MATTFLMVLHLLVPITKLTEVQALLGLKDTHTATAVTLHSPDSAHRSRHAVLRATTIHPPPFPAILSV